MQIKHDLIAPFLANSTQNGLAHHSLYSGSRFQAFKTSMSYDLEVILQHVNWQDSFICGYLSIKVVNLEIAPLTTFFDGEIISEKYPFSTNKWGANVETDKEYWGKFKAFERYQNTFNSPEFNYKELPKSDFVFMRWKEHFLLSDDDIIREINGAPIPGFYYICFTKSTGNLDGCYYHKPSEKYESFQLKHVPQRSIDIFEFR
uniref:Uncharacterized protein n=1 Tax=Glossina brevipalpis TaxID=37001 RepID=A0A1A9W3U7_9MUSC